MHSPGKDGKKRKWKANVDDFSSDVPRKKYSMKRRGRPASTSRKDMKAGKSHPKRSRARVGYKPAKICESESDVDACSEDTGKKEESEIGLEIHGAGDLVDKKESVNIESHEIGQFSESSQRGKGIENKDVEGTEQSKWFDSIDETGMEEKNSIGSSEKLEKLEVMVDPVQSMLLDMIPSLGTQTSTVSESKPQPSNPIAVAESKPQPSDPNQVPAKRKKVSLKDLANELLGD